MASKGSTKCGRKKLIAETFVPRDRVVFCTLHMKSGLKNNFLKH